MSTSGIMLIVQGEGRGHLSQAIALKEILETAGFSITSVLTGKSKGRKIPEYFISCFENKIIEIESPGLILNSDQKKVLFSKTLFNNFLKIPHYFRQIKIIHQEFKKAGPELVLNFHEILCGFWKLFYHPKVKIISIAHQYIYYHYLFKYPAMPFHQKLALKLVNYFTTIGSVKRIGLHFFQWESVRKYNLVILPPLIRQRIKLLKPENQNYILIYLLYPGLSEEVKKFQERNPDQYFHVFWSEDNQIVNEHLIFMKLNSDSFLTELKNCRAFISTAGFESIAECYYLEKPVGVIPVSNHPEQFINACETAKSGIGIAFSDFSTIDISQILKSHPSSNQYRQWVNSGDELFITEINKILNKTK